MRELRLSLSAVAKHSLRGVGSGSEGGAQDFRLSRCRFTGASCATRLKGKVCANIF